MHGASATYNTQHTCFPNSTYTFIHGMYTFIHEMHTVANEIPTSHKVSLPLLGLSTIPSQSAEVQRIF